MSDSEGDSERDELEEAEMRLYAQLYFEPNPDYEPKVLGTESGLWEDNPSIHDRAVKEPSDFTLCNGSKESTPELKDNIRSKDDSINCIKPDMHLCSGKDENVKESCEEQLASTSDSFSKNPQTQHKNVSRERYSSICSVDSISGSVPLDNLYCTGMNVMSDDEVEDLDKRLAISKALEEEVTCIAPKFNRSSISRKRKRVQDLSDSDVEESRCDSIAKKQLCSDNKDSEVNYDSCSSSDDDVYFMPPTRKEIELVTLSSTSDTEIQDMKKKKGKALIKTKNTASVFKEINQNDSSTADEDSESDTDTDSLELIEMESLTTNVRNIKGYRESKRQVLQSKTFDYSKILSRTNHAPSCAKWTVAMTKFYDSDISEDLHVQDVHGQQTDSADDWSIDVEDYPVGRRSRYYNREVRCLRCRQFGHSMKECPRVPHCHLCSAEDHIKRHNCPDNCCFRCGEDPHVFCKKTTSSVQCQVCGYYGHSKELCPDLWRRFHLTTSGLQAVLPPENGVRPKSEQYCYVCTKQGHYGHQCPKRYSSLAYCPVPQTAVTYDSPVKSMNGKLVVNAAATVKRKDADFKTVTRIRVESQVIGRIMGRKGVILQEIQKLSNAKIIVAGPLVNIMGSKKERIAAKEMIGVLLGNIAPDEHTRFIKHIAEVSENNGLLDSLQSSSSKEAQSRPALMELTEQEKTSAEEIDLSKGCVKSWTSHFLNSLPRAKDSVLSRIQFCIKDLETVDFDVNRRLKLMKKYIRQMNLNNSELFIYKIERILKELARVVIGREKYGEGKEISSSLKKLYSDVEASKENKVPEEKCKYLGKILSKVYSPSFDEVGTIMNYAEDYLKNERLKRKATRGAFSKEIPNSPKNLFSEDMEVIKFTKLNDTRGETSFTQILKEMRKGGVKDQKRLSYGETPFKKKKKDKVYDVKCDHSRKIFKCKFCKHKVNSPKAWKQTGKKKGRPTSRFQNSKEARRRPTNCKHGFYTDKCKKCYRSNRPKRNSKRYWVDEFD